MSIKLARQQLKELRAQLTETGRSNAPTAKEILMSRLNQIADRLREDGAARVKQNTPLPAWPKSIGLKIAKSKVLNRLIRHAEGRNKMTVTSVPGGTLNAT